MVKISNKIKINKHTGKKCREQKNNKRFFKKLERGKKEVKEGQKEGKKGEKEKKTTQRTQKSSGNFKVHMENKTKKNQEDSWKIKLRKYPRN